MAEVFINKATGTKAFWVDVRKSSFDNGTPMPWSAVADVVGITLDSLGYNWKGDYNFSNGLFDLFLESVDNGNGVGLRLEPRNDPKILKLALASHERSYYHLKCGLLDYSYSLRIATEDGGSMELENDEDDEDDEDEDYEDEIEQD